MNSQGRVSSPSESVSTADYRRTEQKIRDQAAEHYDDWYIQSKGEWFDRREKAIFRACGQWPAQAAVLDLGAGTGRITSVLLERTGVVTAIDLSHRSLQVLLSKSPAGVRAAQAAAGEPFPFRDGSYDVIVSCQVIQHIPYPALVSLMCECRRILKPGGVMHVSVYNGHASSFGGVREEVNAAGLYSRRFLLPDLKALADRSGLTLQNVSFYRSSFTPPPRMVRRVIRKLPMERWDEWVSSLPVVARRSCRYILAEFVAPSAGPVKSQGARLEDGRRA